MQKLNFEVVVVANHHRKAIILDHLKEVPHSISYSEDHDLPINWVVKPEYSTLVQHMHGHTGHHRCIEGHKSALRLCKSDFIFVIEDDAVPNRSDWLDVVKQAVPLLRQFELVSLHGRNFDRNHFNGRVLCDNIHYYTFKPIVTFKYVLGSLAYLIKKKDADKIYQHNYNGLGMDLFIANNFNFCLVDPSPFDHNRSQGSLIDPDTFT